MRNEILCFHKLVKKKNFEKNYYNNVKDRRVYIKHIKIY